MRTSPRIAERGVALVFPYFRTRARTELLFPPLGLAALLTQLRRLGVEARVFDCTFRDFDSVVEDIVAYRPAIVGFSAMVSLTAPTLRFAAVLRQRVPETLLVAGGPLPTVFPDRFLPQTDAVFRGEADLSFPRFCRDYLALRTEPDALSSLPLGDYEGLVIRSDELQVDNPPVHQTAAQIAAYPAPDRSQFDHVAYQREWSQQGMRPTTLVATFGCPYGCEFCSKPVWGNEVRRRPLDAVFSEIDEILRLGYDALWIADDTFTLDSGYLREFCRRARRLPITWSCLSRSNGSDPATARAMKAAGCRRVHLGLESGSQATLDLMHKQATVEQGVRAATIYHEAGIEVAAFFIVGYPGETTDDVEKTFSLALELPLDEISFNVPMPLPGSRLWERLAMVEPGLDWTHENDPTLVFDSDFDEAWLRRRIDETMDAFAARRSRPAAARSTAARSPIS